MLQDVPYIAIRFPKGCVHRNSCKYTQQKLNKVPKCVIICIITQCHDTWE